MLAASRQYSAQKQQSTQQQEQGGGGLAAKLGQGLGVLISNSAVETALRPLEFLGVPQRTIASTINEIGDAVNGEGFSPQDWYDQINPLHTFTGNGDATFGMGDVLPDTGNKWLDRAVGFGADIVTDPLTYLSFGVAPVAGKGARMARAAKLLEAQREATGAAKFADELADIARGLGRADVPLPTHLQGAAERAAALGGDEALQRIGKRGLGTANAEQLAAMELRGQGARLRNPLTGKDWTKPIPGTQNIGKGVNEAFGAARVGVKKLPGADAVMHARSPKGYLSQDLTPAFDRFIAGKGGVGVRSAIDQVSFDEAMRDIGGTFGTLANQELEQVAKELKDRGPDGWKLMRAEAADGQENALTGLAAKIREIADFAGQRKPGEAAVIPDIEGMVYSMPHVLHRDFRNFLKNAIEQNDPNAIAFERAAGIRTEDLLEDSGFLQRRAFRPDPETGEPLKFRVGKSEIEIVKGTVDELNEKFAAMFPGYRGAIYEENPILAYRQYIRGVSRDVAKRGAGKRMAGTGNEAIKHAGPAPESFDPAGGRVPMEDGPDRVTMQEGGLQENEFYTSVRDSEATKTRDANIVASQTALVNEYQAANTARRAEIASEIQDTISEIVAPVREQRAAAVAARTEARASAKEARADVVKVIDDHSAARAEAASVQRQIATTEKAIDDLDQYQASIERLTEANAKREMNTVTRRITRERAALVQERDDLLAAVPQLQEAEQRMAKLLSEANIESHEEALARLEAQATDIPQEKLTPKQLDDLREAQAWLQSPERQQLDALLTERSNIEVDVPVVSDETKALVRELEDQATREHVDVVLASASGKRLSAEKTALGLERDARKGVDKVTALLDRQQALEDSVAYYSRTLQGFRGHKARASKKALRKVRQEIEDGRAEVARLRAEADAIRTRSVPRYRDAKTVDGLKSKLAATKRKLTAAKAKVKAEMDAGYAAQDKRLAELDTEMKPLLDVKNRHQAALDAFTERSGRPTRSVAPGTETARRRVDQAKQYVEERPATPTPKQVADAEGRVGYAKALHDNAAKATEETWKKKIGGIPDRKSVEASVRHIYDNMEVRREYIRLNKQLQLLGATLYAAPDNEVGRLGKAANWSSKKAAKTPVDNTYLSGYFGDIFEKDMPAWQRKVLIDRLEETRATLRSRRFRDMAEAIDTVEAWRTAYGPEGVITREMEPHVAYLRKAVNDLRTLRGEGTELDAIKGLEAEAQKVMAEQGDINALSAQIDALDRQSTTARATASRKSRANTKAKSAEVGKEAEAQRADLEQLKTRSQELDDQASGTISNYQTALSDLDAARANAAQAQQGVEQIDNVLNSEGSRATRLSGATLSEEAVPGTKALDGALEDAEKIARSNINNDPNLNKTEAALHAHHLDLEELKANELIARDVNRIVNSAAKGELGSVISAKLRDDWVQLVEGTDIVMSRDLANAMKRMEVLRAEPGMFGRTLTAFTNFFKTYATMTPGFHVRNALGAIFTNTVDGVRLGTQRRGVQLWREFAASPEPLNWLLKQDQEVIDAFRATFASGAGGRFFEAGIADANQTSGKFKEWLYANRATKASQRVGQDWVEGPVRLGAALQTTMDGGDVGEALTRVTRLHFDYAQVSSFDEQAKKMIPFWTFMSRNLPTQVTLMWTKPRVYSYYNSFVNNMADPSDPLVPEYWTRAGAFNTGLTIGGTPLYLSPDLQHVSVAEDAEMLQKLAQGNPNQLLSSFNPFFTAPVEYATGTNLFTGFQTGPDELRKAGPLEVPAAIIGGILGKNKTGDGGLFVNERIAQSLQSTIPDLDRANRLLPGMSGDDYRRGAAPEGWARYFGLPIRMLTPERQQAEARRRSGATREQAAMQRLVDQAG